MRCGYCRHPGHNRRSCDILTKDLQRRAENAGKGSWADARYQEHLNKKKSRKKGNMRCSYCAVMGHTRKTCALLYKDIKWYVNFHNSIVDGLKQVVKEAPIGKGSLIALYRRMFNTTTQEYCVSRVGFGIVLGLRIPVTSVGLLTRNQRVNVEVLNINSSRKYILSYSNLLCSRERKFGFGVFGKIINNVPTSHGEGWAEEYKTSFKKATEMNLFRRQGTSYMSRRSYDVSRIVEEKDEAVVNAWKVSSIIEDFRKSCTKQ